VTANMRAWRGQRCPIAPRCAIIAAVIRNVARHASLALLLLAAFPACKMDDVVAYTEAETTAGNAGTGGAGGNAGTAAGGAAGSGGTTACAPNCNCLTLSGHSYMVCRDLVTRQQAEMRCAEYGMQLVRPDSQEENFLVRGAASNAELMSFWLGCNDVATEGTVIWSDGTPIDQTYSNFIDIDPGDNEPQDCCVEYASASWHDEPCDSTQGVVCERY
jgi:hypothetical protein